MGRGEAGQRRRKRGIECHFFRKLRIYRNRANLQFCKEHGIRLSGPALGRPRKNAKTDKKTEYADNADRIAIERAFALAKQKYGLGLITSKLDQTTRSAIALSVIAMNVDQIYRSLCA